VKPQPQTSLTTMSDADLHRLIAEQRRAPKLAADAFVAAVSTGNIEALAVSLDDVETTCAWPLVFRRCARLTDVSEEMRQAMLRIWITSGDHLRGEVGDDLVLKTALRVLLPQYQGPPITIYRGDSLWNRRRRTYGLSWTTDEQVADGFAQGLWRTMEGGSVVLRAVAPPEAIICDASLVDDDRYGEAECLVDRRLLSRVDVIRRYAQAPMGAV
jgi:hypothetical protein